MTNSLVFGFLWLSLWMASSLNAGYYSGLQADASDSSDESWEIVQLVKDAVQQIQQKGDAVFFDFAMEGSK